MKKKCLALLLVALPFSSFAGEIAVNCDSRVINKNACVSILQNSLKELGCRATESRCLLHPWGSDFIKSWICSAQSANCTASLQAACPAGSSQAFNEAIDVCVQSKTLPSSVHGVCKHEHAAHSVTVKDCNLAPSTCAKLGGTPLQCTSAGSDLWEVSCGFPSLQIPESATTCSELRSKCELINTETGVKGTLLNCL